MQNRKNKYLKKIFPFFLTGLLLFIFPSQVFAHIGGGPPFLKVNGKFAQTNPYYQQELTTLQVPQDSPPESYLVGKPITLFIDFIELTKQTTLPPEMVKDLSIRWSVATGINFDQKDSNYRSGSEVTYTFERPQSYLIIVEGKTPLDDDYIVLDTVQLNVLPSESYQLPSVSVFIGVQGDAGQRPSLFVSRADVAKESTVKDSLWDFHEGKLAHGTSIEHRFNAMTPYNTRIIYHRVVDSQGFIADVGFAAENYQGSIQFVPFSGMKNAPITIGTYIQAQKLTNQHTGFTITKFLGIAVGFFVSFTLIIFSSKIVNSVQRRLKSKRLH